jgi:hypothetical protein
LATLDCGVASVDWLHPFDSNSPPVKVRLLRDDSVRDGSAGQTRAPHAENGPRQWNDPIEAFFFDLSSSKRRPALVISPDAFNDQMEDVVVAAITSQLTPQ